MTFEDILQGEATYKWL